MERYLTRDRLLEVSKHKHFGWGVSFVIALLILDLLFLNYKIIFVKPTLGSNIQSQTTQTASNSEGSTITEAKDSCGQNCQAYINKAISDAMGESRTTSVGTNTSANPASEYFVPLGSGVINSTSWQTVAGMQAYIDSSAYSNIGTVTFEISISIPSGNETANFQLYDQTQNHPVWNSEVTFTGGGTPQLLISAPITLDPGNNLYVVQAQTQLPFPAYITQARVHIITQ
ncbi:MAG TPA: hypothetical protein VHE53_00590 [Patescibacteria group bacterium]|nr:hypothetical protein [Patescibacteria group bacterium]